MAQSAPIQRAVFYRRVMCHLWHRTHSTHQKGWADPTLGCRWLWTRHDYLSRLSHSFWLSLAMLFLLGGFDNISVVIRSTLLLTRTPNAMLRRISSVNTLFIGASN